MAEMLKFNFTTQPISENIFFKSEPQPKYLKLIWKSSKKIG